MVQPSRSSFPAPSEPSLRRLGVGGGGGGDRPLRAQVVVAVVVVLVLIGVPLYVLRRPTPAPSEASASASAPAAPILPSPISSAPLAVAEDAGAPERVKLGPPQRLRCSASARARGQDGSLCDSLGALEAALAKAIQDAVDCAPKPAAEKEGTINFVLNVDWSSQQLHVFAGASGTWRGPQARRAAKCVKSSLAAPGWQSLPHQYRYYQIAILATYSAPAPPRGVPGAPVFE
ncbi:MAG: hypothetical protein IT376_20915 [Polyangiaceae bacterium]|nr:hypothetical protein [Polyangiaceae bacterium]